MSEHGLGAIVLEPGTSLRYFVDVSLGHQRAPVPAGHPREGRARLRRACLRRGARAGDHPVQRRRAGVAGRGGLGSRRVRHPEGPRRRHGHGRHRGARALLHRRRSACRSARQPVRAGHRRDGRLPDDQVAGRDCADAARQRHHHRRLQGRVRIARRGDDAVRAGEHRERGVRRARGERAAPSRSSASTPPFRTAASRRSG